MNIFAGYRKVSFFCSTSHPFYNMLKMAEIKKVSTKVFLPRRRGLARTLYKNRLGSQGGKPLHIEKFVLSAGGEPFYVDYETFDECKITCRRRDAKKIHRAILKAKSISFGPSKGWEQPRDWATSA